MPPNKPQKPGLPEGGPGHKKKTEKKEAAHKGGQVHNIQSKTRKKLDRFFKWALLVSFLGHSPAIFGTGEKKEKDDRNWNFNFNFWGNDNVGTRGGAGNSGKKSAEGPEQATIQDETPPEWEKEVRESLEKELGKEDAEKVIGDIDPEALSGFKKAEEAIKQRQAERAKRIDKQKLEEYKKQLLERLEKGEKILFRDFVFELELLGLGIDPKDIDEAKKIFMDEMHELEKTRPAIPTREFLQKVVSLSESEDKDKNNNSTAYEPTRTSLAEYLVRKKQGKRGNCKARGKYEAMALEYLYSQRRNDIMLQKGGDHIRTLFQVGDKIYVMEPGVAIVTMEDLKGTITFNLDEYMLSSAGKKLVKHVDEAPKEKPKADLPTINDDNGVFAEPEADGRLRNFSDNHQFLYKEKFTPPETAKMELAPSSRVVHEQNERIKKERERQADEYKARMERNAERVEKLRPGQRPEPPANGETPIDVSDWVVVLNDHKHPGPEESWKEADVREILPWKQKDYPEIELSDRIQGDRFNGGQFMFQGPAQAMLMPGLINPSPKTIKAINGFALKTVEYEDHALYGQETWHEIFNTQIPQIKFNLSAARLSMDFEHLVASQKDNTARKYGGETALNILPSTYLDPEGLKVTFNAARREKYKPFVEFPQDQFRALLQGEGGLHLQYPERDFSEQEIEMIANSTRPYVLIDGYVCNFQAKALLKMKQSKKTVLVLKDNIYSEVIHRFPELLLEPHVKMEQEYFMNNANVPDMGISEHAMINLYALREALLAKPSAMDYTTQTGMEFHMLFGVIWFAEKKFLSRWSPENQPTMGQAQLDALRAKARLHYQDTHDDGPIGSMGVCLPPDDVGTYYVERDSNIQKYAEAGEESRPSNITWTEPNGQRITVAKGEAPGTFYMLIKNQQGIIVGNRAILKDSDGTYYRRGPNSQSFALPQNQQEMLKNLDQ